MKDYKRLTERNKDGSYSFMYEYNATTPPIKTLLDRLAELEDKIENGTLIPKYCEMIFNIFSDGLFVAVGEFKESKKCRREMN